MDNQRLIVWAAFGLLAFMTYQAWLQDYGPAPVTEEIANQASQHTEENSHESEL